MPAAFRQIFRVPLLCRFLLILLAVLPPSSVLADSASDRIQEIFRQGWELEGRMHLDLANLDRAMALYEEAIRLAPDNDEARWRLAEVTFKKSEEVQDRQERKRLVEGAIALAEQALALNPRSVGGMYWAGTAYARLADMSGMLSAIKQINQSKTYLHRAIATDPDHRLAVLSGVILARIYSEAPWPVKDQPRAMKLALWAYGKDPDLTIASLSLAKVYLAEGQTVPALALLQKCLATEHPTYIWDAVLYDWPDARKTLAGIRQE
jgi:tetratricopeptide (TPR) repeat protein